ncbi:hypothetical protein [Rhodohalobacter sp. 8-1]|uniref:hypothetical protein n=1 Tax=Rhodohalobacter sp. 8-1 TaxID=3131972 RepID=UPI0030EB40CF
MNDMRYTTKSLFLIDAAGACTTALLLSQVLARYESVFGIPVHILYILTAIAICFAIYSSSCYLLVEKNKATFLKVIAAANLLYCILTLGLIILYVITLTWIGIAYFIGEIMVILTLVWLELRTSREHL